MNTTVLPNFHFVSGKEWQKWLKKNHANSPGIWMKIAKKTSQIVSVTYDEALLIALCYGWIDGQKQKFDEQYWLQKFTQRGAKSIWSKRNCELSLKLIKESKMKAPGLEKINAAKKDGRWGQAYDSPKNMVIPNDFLNKLSKNKKVLTFFKTLNKTNTYAIGWRLQTAKKAETKERRMKVILEMLAKGETFH